MEWIIGIALVSFIVNVVLLIMLRLNTPWGEGETQITVAGMRLQLNHQIWRVIHQGMTRDEDKAVRLARDCELMVVRAYNRYHKTPNEATEARLAQAQDAFAEAQTAASLAYERATYRWLCTTDGQQWCAERGIVFPPPRDE